MPAKYTASFVDRSNEKSSTTICIPDLSSANYDDVAGNGVGNNVGDLRIALAALSLCNFTGHVVTGAKYPDVGTIPASPYAQREIKLRIDYLDNVTGEKFHFTIPGPNLAVFGQTGSDVIDPEEVAVAAFITAFEANAVSPRGNPVSYSQGVIVGRRA